MTARQLLQLYPRAWRERYGDEFAEFVGDRRLSAQQMIDIVGGALDAWTSRSVRASVGGSVAGNSTGGASVVHTLKLKCASRTAHYTTKDALIGAGVMIGATFVLLAIGIGANRSGYPALGETLKGLAFPASMLLSMPFYLTKGLSWRAQAILLGVPTAILIAISYVATRSDDLWSKALPRSCFVCIRANGARGTKTKCARCSNSGRRALPICPGSSATRPGSGGTRQSIRSVIRSSGPAPLLWVSSAVWHSRWCACTA